MSCLCNNDAELVGHLFFSLWEAMLALLCIQESGPLSSNVCLQWSDNNMGHFKTLPMFAAWWIWKVRNLFIFEGLVRQPHLHSWLSSLIFFFLWTICRLLIQRSLRLKTGPFQYPPIPLSDNVGLLWSSLTGFFLDWGALLLLLGILLSEYGLMLDRFSIQKLNFVLVGAQHPAYRFSAHIQGWEPDLSNKALSVAMGHT